jgi:hypothetical protein
MGQLRDRMEQDLKLRGVSPATIRNYLLYCRKFAAFFMRSPEQLGAAEVRAFLLHQIEIERLAYASYRQVCQIVVKRGMTTCSSPERSLSVPLAGRHDFVADNVVVGAGGGPNVAVFSGADASPLSSFFPFDVLGR